MRPFLILAPLVLLAGAARADTPTDYAWQRPIEAPGEAPAYVLELDAEVLSQVQRRDLSDLAVFNAAGEPVPFAPWPPAPDVAERREPLAWLRVPRPAPGTGERLDLQLERDADGRLRRLDLQAEVNLGRLVIDALPLGNVQIKARGKGGLIELERLRADLYDGTLDAQARLDLRQPEPQLSVQKTIARLQLEPLLARHGEKAPLSGRLNLEAQLCVSGNSQRAWVEQLQGKAGFLVSDGMLPDANLEQQLCSAIATLNRKPLSGETRGRDTPFSQLTGSLQIRNGVASNPDLKARIPGLSVNGNGDLDLRVLGMDYRVGIIIEGDARPMPDPACQVNERYVGLEWPLRCRGPLELGSKACRLDQDGLGKIAARLAGDRLSEKLEEKLGEKVSPELRDALKGLFQQ